MATITDTAAIGRERRSFRSALKTLGSWLETYMEKQARTDQIKALFDMSDEQLAQRGIRRDEIVRHVYRDRFHV